MNKSLKNNVFLLRCEDYGEASVQRSANEILLQLTEDKAFYGHTVLLKPNLISSRGPKLSCTHPQVIGEVARWFIDRGAKVKIGDSPAFGTTQSVIESQGMATIIQQLPCELVQFKTAVEKQLYPGMKVMIAREGLECDLMVNLPRLKAHNQMYLTAGVKNLFGMVVGVRKAMLHMTQGGSHADFSEMLLGLADAIPNHITLLDGVEAMHQSGPLDGSSLSLQLMAGSVCPVALDTALLDLLELNRKESPLWCMAAQKKHTGSYPEQLHYPLLHPDDFNSSGFIAPERLDNIRFNPFRLLISAFKRFGLSLGR